MKSNRSNNIGEVSSGTMLTEDLIPAFLGCLEAQKPLQPEHKRLASEIRERMDAEDYYETETADWDLDSLFDALDEYAPDYWYFGSNEGDGASYGFWLSEEWQERLKDDGGIVVSDQQELPADQPEQGHKTEEQDK